ncbi:MAG: DUF2156 domain-containing protein [Treponema sp.]|nr:DUF2156 domain-containing protein [Treponema sp.]
MTFDPIDFIMLKQNIDAKELYGSDSSLGNLFLLQPKYDIDLFCQHKILFRRYHGTENRTGWGFPIPLQSADSDYLKTALTIIFETAKHEKSAVRFCLCTQEQKNHLDSFLSAHFSGKKIAWKTNRDDSDYLYLQKNLADLPGAQYQKKRNHVSRFKRTYGDDWEFKSYPENDIADDILAVEETWFSEKSGEEKPELILERDSVQTALSHTEEFGFRGGVLYIHGKPAAMTLASPVSDCVLDVHFEKAVAEHEPNGVFAAINQQFAKRCGDFLYLNREEDMGVEGLRKAKLSYKPEIILDKYYGTLAG